jgi:hypothetical protein
MAPRTLTAPTGAASIDAQQLRVGASRMRFRIAAVPPMSRHPLPSHEAAE